MTEKLFIASDIHDDVEALEVFVDFAQAQQADRILLLGDLSLRPYTAQDLQNLVAQETAQGIPQSAVQAFIDAKNRHNSKVLTEMKRRMDNSGIPYHVIPGNYDGSLEPVFGDRDLHLKTAQFGEAKVAGYGGANSHPRHIQLLVDLGQITPFDHQQLYDFLSKERPMIGIIHNPPQGFCDVTFKGQNVGTPATTAYIQQHMPKLILSGHIHEAGPNANNPKGVEGIAGCESSGKRTIVINPGNLGRFDLLKMPNLETVMSFDHGTFSEVHIEADGTPIKLSHYSVQPEKEFRQRGLTERHVGPVRKLAEYAL
ncbi:metallophosphoesterase family protein [Candidatus Woesearchaeota archaeon]|nr:metallophosphoesterase family protein [Candidatus Woesearchaeota archaeon]